MSQYQGFGGLVYPTRKIRFMFSVVTADVNDEYLDEMIELRQSQVQEQLFRTTTLSMFWCHQIVAYPLIAKKALEILIPFVTSYLCQQSLSRILDIETKKRNKLCCVNDMRVAKVNCAFLKWSVRGNSKSHFDCSKYS